MTTSLSTTSIRVIAVTADHLDLAGDARAALFLAQALFWWFAAGRRKYYKFNAPCSHPRYRPGDSWQEELRLTRTTLATARRRVAVRVRMSSEAEIHTAFAAGALMVYGTDESHLTWYMVNEMALAAAAPALHARLTRSGATPGRPPAPRHPDGGPKQPTRSGSPVPAVERVPAPPQRTTPSPGNSDTRHSLMQECDTGCSTEPVTETTSPTASETTCCSPLSGAIPPLPTPSNGVEEGEVSPASASCRSALLSGLRERGVQRQPARLIAQRAASAGWRSAQTLETLDAHVRDADATGARSPLGVAVSRMLDGPQLMPAPAQAVERLRRHRQAQAWKAERDAVNGPEGRDDSSVVPDVVDETLEQSSLARLWGQVLGDIKLQVTRATFERRFADTWLEQEGRGYIVRTRDPYTVEWLQHRLNRLVVSTLKQYVRGVPAVKFQAL